MLLPWQARASEFHPYLVKSLDALPDSLRSAAGASIPPGAKATTICVMPQDYRSKGLLGSRIVPEQAIIFTGDGVLAVQAGLPGEHAPSPAFLPCDGLLFARSSLLLNYGRLEMAGAAQGRLVSQDAEFGALAWRLMDAALRSFLAKALGLTPLPPDDLGEWQEEATDMVRGLPLKFANGLRTYALQPGETLLGTVFQEAVWAKRGGLWPQQLTPRRLLALTDAAVVLIEEEQALVRKSSQYGWIITQMPRAAVRDLQTAPAQEGLQELKFTLARGGASTDRRTVLAAGTVNDWLRLWEGRAAALLPHAEAAL